MRTKKTVVVNILAFLLSFCLFSSLAEAADVRLGVGFGYSNNTGARYQELMLLTDDRRWYGAVTRIGNDDRHNYQYSRFTAGYRVNWRLSTKVSSFLRLGAAYFSEEPTDYISDKLAFDIAIGVRLWNVLEIEFDQHNSTAGRSTQNEGLDAVLVGIVFPF